MLLFDVTKPIWNMDWGWENDFEWGVLPINMSVSSALLQFFWGEYTKGYPFQYSPQKFRQIYSYLVTCSSQITLTSFIRCSSPRASEKFLFYISTCYHMLLMKFLKASIWSPIKNFFVFRYNHCDSLETMRKLYLSTRFSHQEIRWNHGILRSEQYKIKNILFTIFNLASVKKIRNFHNFTDLLLYFTIFFIVLEDLNELCLLDCICVSAAT